MSRSPSTFGAACGGVFALVLFVAVGDGSHAFSGFRAVASLVALTLAIPFVVYVGGLLRTAEGTDPWLANTAVAAGVTGIALKLASAGPELAVHRANLAGGTTLHKVMEEVGGALTVFSLYPLAVFCIATAVVALRTRVMPLWLGVGAALTGTVLAVNGAFLEASVMPGLLLFIAWSLAASVHLVLASRRPQPAWRQPAQAEA